MKVGVFTAILNDQPLEKALDFLASIGVTAVEFGTGAYPPDAHTKPDDLLADKGKLAAFKQAVASRGMEISSLSCHGNPIHPDKEFAQSHHDIFRKTLKLAELLEVPRVTTFSGCPGDGPSATYPNWVTCPWPDDFLKVLEWQWNEVVIPYWAREVEVAKSHGINQICLEMHPGFVVYNGETLLKLRNAVGPVIGANFDPSHLFWQGIDPVRSLRDLKGAIYHVHAKDTRVYEENSLRNGVLDTKPYSQEADRAWIFRTVGYGHGADFWGHFVSTLRLIGYDGVLSMEHEDSLMTPSEGLKKGVKFLQDIIMHEPKGVVSWA
ncbi:xylose isomerase [Verrucomicrobia bacterium LW23]|nr:xylose isomerase [Verrucomicrobia bacterium LW23]